jgi:predicted 3-demethylubiquinone-9 3-methyltransferase (glyoxalase superfamily)
MAEVEPPRVGAAVLDARHGIQRNRSQVRLPSAQFAENVMANTQRISPCLWFDHQAEEAASFYVSIFKNSRIVTLTRYSEAGREIHRRPPGSVMTVAFELDGQSFTALNGGPVFQFSEAISFQIDCESQKEIDYYWSTLSQGGDPNAQQCGWLKDRYGVSWQVVPAKLIELLKDNTSDTARRAMEAMLRMKKIDIAEIERAVAVKA